MEGITGMVSRTDDTVSFNGIPRLSGRGRHVCDTSPGVDSPKDETASLDRIPQVSGRVRHGCGTSPGVDFPMDGTASLASADSPWWASRPDGRLGFKDWWRDLVVRK